jgi:hypothetical protein
MVATVNASTSAGVVITPDNSGVLAFQSSSATALTIDASQNVGIGTASPGAKFSLTSTGSTTADGVRLTFGSEARAHNIYSALPTGRDLTIAPYRALTINTGSGTAEGVLALNAYEYTTFGTGSSYTERMRIDSSGSVLMGKTVTTFSTAGLEYDGTNKQLNLTTSGNSSLRINRTTNDGVLVSFQQDAAEEGTISVSGTTVSYNGGHLSRYAQTTTAKDESLVKGTVLSNLDAMNVYTKDGQPVANEQLNKVKVSDVEGDANVAGVFVNWSYDEQYSVDEVNMAMTGDMIIRIAQGVTVQRGDLLMSAGDGTAKTQGDDIVRSKTIAKVTSNHVTCTYEDGSYCVPCVLMAC